MEISVNINSNCYIIILFLGLKTKGNITMSINKPKFLWYNFVLRLKTKGNISMNISLYFCGLILLLGLKTKGSIKMSMQMITYM